jgi:c-di-GMP-binding flagellar brake protein YcgR
MSEIHGDNRELDMSEKRRYGRLPVELPVILRHGGHLIPATMLNISTGGMYLRVESSPIQSDRPVEIIFDLNGKSRDVAMRGLITRVDDEAGGRGLGVQFTNLFSLSHRAVQQYVTEHLH